MNTFTWTCRILALICFPLFIALAMMGMSITFRHLLSDIGLPLTTAIPIAFGVIGLLGIGLIFTNKKNTWA